jgi:hypothetical protein
MECVYCHTETRNGTHICTPCSVNNTKINTVQPYEWALDKIEEPPWISHYGINGFRSEHRMDYDQQEITFEYTFFMTQNTEFQELMDDIKNRNKWFSGNIAIASMQVITNEHTPPEIILTGSAEWQ